MSRIVLHAAHYERENERCFSEATCLVEASRTLGRRVGQLVTRHGAPTCGKGHPETLICSTTISDLFYDRDDLNAAFRQSVEMWSGTKVDQIISTYECASWGYALRYLAHHRRFGYITLIIVDPNLPYFTFWERDQAWGKSGHGVLVLALELLPDFGDDLHVDYANQGKGLLDFARATQRCGGEWASTEIFIPFLTPAMRPVFERLAVARYLGPNFYECYGHCFGSDPWMGLIKRFGRAHDAGQSTAIVGSFALNGYFCLARIDMADQTMASINV